MVYSNLENNLLRVLSFASTRATWVSCSSCASMTGVSYDSVRQYLMIDEFAPTAWRFHYNYAIRNRGRTFYISVVSHGYV